VMDFGLVVFDDEAIDSGLQLDNQDEDPAPPSLVGGVVVEDKMGNAPQPSNVSCPHPHVTLE